MAPSKPTSPLSTLRRRINVTRSRYADEIDYERARLIRGLMLVLFPIDLLFIPASFWNPAYDHRQQVNGALTSAFISAFLLLVYWVSGRGSRGMKITGWVLVPFFLLAMTGGAIQTGGLQAPAMHGIWGAVVLAGVLIGTPGVLATWAMAVIAVGGLAVATARGQLLPRQVQNPATDALELFASIALNLLFVAFVVISMERIWRRLLRSAVENERAQKAERARTEALAELDRTRTIFFSDINHELRTPLSLSLGVIETALERPDLPDDLRQQLAAVRRNDRRLLKLVNTLLDFARIEADRLDALYEPVDLSATTAGLVGEFRSAIERAGLRLSLDLPKLAQPVYVDREMWEKIVFNLLSNALKFTLRGEIAVSLRERGDRVELSVRDTGCGIPPRALPLLFRRFQRLEVAEARSRQGSGIGLALVSELLRLHGGQITADSEVGVGTTFRVELQKGHEHLPAQRIGARTPQMSAVAAAPFVEEALLWLPDGAARDLDALPVGPGAADAERGGPPSQEGVSLRSGPTGVAPTQSILLVEDHADMRHYLARLLGARFRVRAVRDVDAALRAIDQQLPDLVLTDWMLPGPDGLDLLRALRSVPERRALPVVLLSARAGADAAIEGLSAGADDYLEKPFSARELLARIGARLELAAARRQAQEMQARFVHTVIHELKNPLSVLKGYLQVVQILIQRGQAAVPPDALGAMTRSEQRLEVLIEDLVSVAKLQAGRLQIRRARCDLKDLCYEVVDELEVASGRHITLSLPPGAVPVDADADRLSQVLSNLVNNAVSYSPDKSPIEVSLRVVSGTAVVSVTDQGPGIPPEKRELIFEPFVRLEEAPRPALDQARPRFQTAGLGLGLFICRSLVVQHDGRVYVDSARPPPGSTFCVELPLAPKA